jgi:hypothetical protein
MQPNIYLEFEASYRGIGFGWYKGNSSIDTPPEDYLYRLYESLALKIKNSQTIELEYINNVYYQVGLLDNKELKESVHCDPKASKGQLLFLQKHALKSMKDTLHKNKFLH